MVETTPTRRSMQRIQSFAFAALTLLCFAPLGLSQPADIVEVRELSATPAEVVLSLRIADRAGTPLGDDAAGGIDGISLRLTFDPPAAVASATLRRSGAAETLKPRFETIPSSAGSISYVVAFDPRGRPALRSDPTEFAQVILKIDRAHAGGVLRVALDPERTVLSDRAGVVTESVSNRALRLGDCELRLR